MCHECALLRDSLEYRVKAAAVDYASVTDAFQPLRQIVAQVAGASLDRLKADSNKCAPESHKLI